jgi:L-2-hydroxyglutarate oxidase LhgO
LEKVRTLVIGAGAIGLAIGNELSKIDPDLVIVEKENSFGKHTSSRNSEVIHAGHYYEPGSLKAQLCVEGNRLLYQYLQENSIPHRNTGKIIVATNQDEVRTLQAYLALGEQNGCQGMSLLARDEVEELEPQVQCFSGLYLPSTGIFDTHKYMQSLAAKIEEQKAFIVYGMEVISIHQEGQDYLVEFSNGEIFQCERVINSAGLWADQIAAMAGLDVNVLGIKQHLCKGEYYKTTKIHGIQHLVYPVADPKGVFLGIHLTINLNGEVRFGPNAWYVDKVEYNFDEQYFDDFYAAINRYIEIAPEDLAPDDTGIRPKLQGPGEGFRDFYIQDETTNGLPGFINLIGIESPGLTASLAIAKYVCKLTHK